MDCTMIIYLGSESDYVISYADSLGVDCGQNLLMGWIYKLGHSTSLLHIAHGREP